jgi:hypothetical protein
MGATPIAAGCEPSKLTKITNILDMASPAPRTIYRHQVNVVAEMELLGEASASRALAHYLDFCKEKDKTVDVSVDGAYYTCRNSQGCIVAITAPPFERAGICAYPRASVVAYMDVAKCKTRTVKHHITGVETELILRDGVPAETPSVLLESMGVQALLDKSDFAKSVRAAGMQVRVTTDGDLKLHKKLQEHEIVSAVVAGAFHISKNLSKIFAEGGRFVALKRFKSSVLKHLSFLRDWCADTGQSEDAFRDLWANTLLHMAGSHEMCPAHSKCRLPGYEQTVTLDRSEIVLFGEMLGSAVDLNGRMENISPAKDSHCESTFKTLQCNSNKRTPYETTEGARFGGTTVTINETIVETYAQVRERFGFSTSDNSKARTTKALVRVPSQIPKAVESRQQDHRKNSKVPHARAPARFPCVCARTCVCVCVCLCVCAHTHVYL